MTDTSQPESEAPEQSARKTAYLAVGGDVPHQDLLGSEPVQLWQQTQEALTAKWTGSSDPASRRQVLDLAGLHEKLAAALLQAGRLRDHHKALIRNATALLDTPDAMLAVRGSEACADFEALLLQARAALDRLTWFVGYRFKNPCKSFRRISNVLADFVEKVPAASELHDIIAETDSWFDGVLGKLTTTTSLRDLVAHHHAVIEGTRTCFGAIRIDRDRVLLTDCELQLPGMDLCVPVLRTAHQTVQHLAFLVLNTIAVFLDLPRLPLTTYVSTWENRTVTLSLFVLDEPEGTTVGSDSLVSVARMNPDGFEMRTDNVSPELFDHAVDLNAMDVKPGEPNVLDFL